MQILLIDHHALFRDGLRQLLQRMPGKIDRILEADNFQDGMRLAGQNPALDMVLLELKSPCCDGVLSVRHFRQRHPHIPLVVLSSEEDYDVIVKALSHGASGYVCKSSTGQVLLNAIDMALSGSIYMPAQVLRKPALPVMQQDDDKTNRRSNSNEYGLTVRQMEILGYLVAGLSNKRIAAATALAGGTVKGHVAAVYQALRVKNRAEAARVARQIGLADMLQA